MNGRNQASRLEIIELASTAAHVARTAGLCIDAALFVVYAGRQDDIDWNLLHGRQIRNAAIMLLGPVALVASKQAQPQPHKHRYLTSAAAAHAALAAKE